MEFGMYIVLQYYKREISVLPWW